MLSEQVVALMSEDATTSEALYEVDFVGLATEPGEVETVEIIATGSVEEIEDRVTQDKYVHEVIDVTEVEI